LLRHIASLDSELFMRLPSYAATTVLVLAAAILSGCGVETEKPSGGQPTFYRSLAAPGAVVDGPTAAAMVSGFRQNNGLGVVAFDPELTRLAEAQAQAMAKRDKLDQNIGGNFNDRVRKSGYDTRNAAENISAGYHTLAEAFSGWRDSPPHRANMLVRGATRMGIAAVYAPGSKYKVFWSLILAAPNEGRG
jgi:hypothetical protein